jgi:hypothetical protein
LSEDSRHSSKDKLLIFVDKNRGKAAFRTVNRTAISYLWPEIFKFEKIYFLAAARRTLATQCNCDLNSIKTSVADPNESETFCLIRIQMKIRIKAWHIRE